MIVVGEGEQIPNTQDYIYDIGQVIMVIGGKKNLHSKGLSDGYDNLRSVYKVTKPDLFWVSEKMKGLCPETE